MYLSVPALERDNRDNGGILTELLSWYIVSDPYLSLLLLFLLLPAECFAHLKMLCENSPFGVGQHQRFWIQMNIWEIWKALFKYQRTLQLKKEAFNPFLLCLRCRHDPVKEKWSSKPGLPGDGSYSVSVL